jgi:hypothetical protein
MPTVEGGLKLIPPVTAFAWANQDFWFISPEDLFFLRRFVLTAGANHIATI